jgi:lipopolysaccharide/colanic/teichoic acid biosynthesis glycosyltransferase
MATTTLRKNVSEDFGTKQTLQPNATNITGFRKLLGIGPKSEFLCNKMLSNSYLSIAHNNFSSAEAWLNDRIANDRSLPDAILYDVDLAGDNAFENIVRFKKTAQGAQIPVILITAQADEDEKSSALRAGADDYYEKDVSVEDLNYRILFLKKLNEIIATSSHKVDLRDPFRVKIWPIKRIFDLCLAIPLFLMISPLFLVIAILIKLDSKGPVFYISKRAGTGYKVFNFYKFRTMKTGADKELNKLKDQNQYAEGGQALFYKIDKDPRVTKIGRFLRNTSLDELPQIVNVIKGNMSLVGNRPLPLYEAMQLTRDQWAMRFNAPAGITGLWQVTKRGKKDMSEEERIRLDISYAKRNSFLFDIKILFKTLPAAIQRESV